jgi:hypothetical protein
MPTPHPADAARRAARDALSSMPPTRRAFVEALHAGHVPPAPGRPVYTLEDLLRHLAGGERYGVGDVWLARALAVPVEYLAGVRGAAGVPAGRE